MAVVRENRGPSDAFAQPKGRRFTPGRLEVRNNTLEDLVAFAHGVTGPREGFIVGWPADDLKGKRFDISATLSEKALSRDDERRVFLDLLTTRFSFKARLVRVMRDGYALTMVKAGKLGPGLRKVDFDCTAMARQDAPKDAAGKSLCRQGDEPKRGGSFSSHGSGEIQLLARQLVYKSRGRTVVDETGLTGFFTWDVHFAPFSRDVEREVREQLGLKLVAKKVGVDVVVIENVKMPAPD